jgi:hypothetical protein
MNMTATLPSPIAVLYGSRFSLMHAAVVGPQMSPLRYTIDPVAQLLAIELLSIDDGPALVAAFSQICIDPHFRPSYDVGVDCNTLRGIPSGEDVKRLARLCVACPRSNAPSHWALIAAWRPLNDAARFFATAVSAPNVTLRVFQAWSDARMWLASMRAVTPSAPWIGPSRALNDLMVRSSGRGR